MDLVAVFRTSAVRPMRPGSVSACAIRLTRFVAHQSCHPQAVAGTGAEGPSAAIHGICSLPGTAATVASMEEEVRLASHAIARVVMVRARTRAKRPPHLFQVQSSMPQATNDVATALKCGWDESEWQSADRSSNAVPSLEDTEPPQEANAPQSASAVNAHIRGSASFDRSRRRYLPQVCNDVPCIPRNDAPCIPRGGPLSSRPSALTTTAFPHPGLAKQEDVSMRDRANSFGRKADSKLSKISRSLSWNTRRRHRSQSGSLDEDTTIATDPSVLGPAMKAPSAPHMFTLKGPSPRLADDANGSPTTSTMELADAPQQRTWSFARRSRRSKVSGVCCYASPRYESESTPTHDSYGLVAGF
jgi:hypothetical protein